MRRKGISDETNVNILVEPKRPAISAGANYGEQNDEEIPRGSESGGPEAISV